MEEDIKILETLIKVKQLSEIEDTNEIIFQSLENLIKGYKELEEKVKIIDHMCLVNKEEYQLIKNNDYIPKSKVREKIEELNDKMAEQVYIIKEFGEHKGNREKLTMYKDYRDAYAELLQEGDDK